MDTFAHALFSGALRKKIDPEKPVSRGTFFAALWWGAFPDLFAFWPIFVGVITTGDFTHRHNFFGIDIGFMYRLSHSLVIIVGIMIVVFLIWRFGLKRSFPYAMLGWPLHIIFDMPTHAPDRYPTPFLFPLSDWTLPFGIAWSTPWFWALTWAVILGIYGYFWMQKKKKS